MITKSQRLIRLYVNVGVVTACFNSKRQRRVGSKNVCTLEPAAERVGFAISCAAEGSIEVRTIVVVEAD